MADENASHPSEEPRPDWQRVDPPHATQALLRLARDPDPPLSELAAAIRRFPDLEESIRLRANAIKEGLPKRIHSLEHALAFLGLTVVRQLIVDRYAGVGAPAGTATARPASQLVSGQIRRSA